MQVGILSVQKLFGQQVHYAVPLYQRPYVWNEKEQWRPLWEDLYPLAEQLAAGKPCGTHFMGASVQEPIPVPPGAISTRRVIDGQQRLTTLQILLKAFRDVASARGHVPHAQALAVLLANSDPLIEDPAKRRKLWPTKSDQADYMLVQDAASPPDLLQTLGTANGARPLKNRNIINAYLFFYREIDGWLEAGGSEAESRVKGLYGAILDHLRVVVIDLDEKDDAQAIFETLNARGAPLLSADLIKNALLSELPPQEAEEAYRKHWEHFDADGGAFWRELVGRGHAQRARIETFLQHALTLFTGEVVSAGHLYIAFRDFHEKAGAASALETLTRLKRLGDIYRRLHGADHDRRLKDFYYRLQVLDVASAWPFILALYEKHQQRPDVLRNVLVDLESFLIRRMVCRLSTRGYNAVFSRLTAVVTQNPDGVEKAVRAELLDGNAETDRFPSDSEFGMAWLTTPIYQHLTRPRLRLLLEALEEALRTKFAEQHAAPKKMTIEHIMPQGWREHWPLPTDITSDRRDRAVQTIGNLTLLNGKFNTHQSNKAWVNGETPENGKRAELGRYSVLSLNKDLCEASSWSESDIEARGRALFQLAQGIWPMPTP